MYYKFVKKRLAGADITKIEKIFVRQLGTTN